MVLKREKISLDTHWIHILDLGLKTANEKCVAAVQ